MNRTILPFVAMLLGGLAACGSSSTTPTPTNLCLNVTCTNGQTCDSATGICTGTVNKCAAITCTGVQTCDANSGACVNPAFPTLTGAQIDRMGRPAINTALTNPFDIYKPNGGAVETGNVTKDRYNIDAGTPTAWQATWTPFVKFHLGIYDALDGICGNQVGSMMGTPASWYTTLAGVLANDSLLLDTTQTAASCGYLGVESNLLLAQPASCGGRTLIDDTIDTSYKVLSGSTAAVPDGIGLPAAVGANANAPQATFPYFGGPV